MEESLLEKLIFSKLIKKYLHRVEPKGLCTGSQEPAICPYPEPDQSRPRTPSYSLKTHFAVIVPPMPRF